MGLQPLGAIFTVFHCFSLFFHRFSLFFAVFFAVFSLYFIDTDDWRMKAASNPLLTDKTVVSHFLPHSVPFWIRIGVIFGSNLAQVLDNISRRLRASFTRLGAEIGKTDWFEAFKHYDTDGGGGIGEEILYIHAGD